MSAAGLEALVATVCCYTWFLPLEAQDHCYLRNQESENAFHSLEIVLYSIKIDLALIFTSNAVVQQAPNLQCLPFAPIPLYNAFPSMPDNSGYQKPTLVLLPANENYPGDTFFAH